MCIVFIHRGKINVFHIIITIISFTLSYIDIISHSYLLFQYINIKIIFFKNFRKVEQILKINTISLEIAYKFSNIKTMNKSIIYSKIIRKS